MTSKKPTRTSNKGRSRATPRSKTIKKGAPKKSKKGRAAVNDSSVAQSRKIAAKKKEQAAAPRPAPKKRVGVVRKVAGGLVAGALKGVASVVEKVAGIEDSSETAVSREFAKVREEVTAAHADLSEEIAVVRQEVGNVNEEVAEISGDLKHGQP